MVKYGDSRRAYGRQRGRHRPKRQPIDAVSVFFSFSVPLLYFFVSFSAWRKSRTSRQPIALALGHSVLGDRKKSFENLWRSSIFPKMIMKTSAMRASERVAGRASLVSSSLWWNGRGRRTIEACSTCPEWVQGKNRKNTVATQKR